MKRLRSFVLFIIKTIIVIIIMDIYYIIKYKYVSFIGVFVVPTTFNISKLVILNKNITRTYTVKNWFYFLK